MLLPKQARPAVRIGTPFRMEHDIGLGEVVKRITTKVGVAPCAPCQERAAAMNRHVVFTGRSPHRH
jgi:hypothetical protein